MAGGKECWCFKDSRWQVGRDDGILKIIEGRWEGMLAFERLEMAGRRDAGVIKIRDTRW
jgi:hypothetical protein